MRKNIIKLSLVFFLSLSNHAQKPSRAEWLKVSSIGLAGAALNFGISLVETPSCAWCTTNKFDHTISQALIWPNLGAARISSDFLAFGIAPLMAFASAALVSKNTSLFARNLLVLFDSVVVTGALTELAKISSRRTRPGAAYGYDDLSDSGANRSFCSGHTSFTFALLSSASVLAYKNNYSWAPYFAGSSALLGALVAYSRIASAKHWMSDILVGMALGIGVGIAMPFITLDNQESLSLSATPQSLLLSYAW